MDKIVTFAIGDVHGCLDQLDALIAVCELISAGRDTQFVLIGDYVDRGPHPRGVVDRLIGLQRRHPGRFVCLRGNHEQMLIAAADVNRSDSDLVGWWANGGEQTLNSYGVDDPQDIPHEHVAWMTDLPLTLADGRRLYVHAGIRPGVSVADQTPHDLIWIREPFLSSRQDHGLLVVHGHTPTRTRLPELRSNRLNIDTGACFGGKLTAAMFSDRERQPTMFVNDRGEIWRPRQVGRAD